MTRLLIALLCGLLSSCAFGPREPWTLEDEQREKALKDRLETARPGERELIQKQIDDLQDRYPYHLDWPEEPPPPRPAVQTEDERGKAADDAIDQQLEEMNSQTGQMN